MKDTFKTKITFTYIFILLWFLVLLLRASLLQIFKQTNLLKKAKKQIVRDMTIYPNRGEIFDKNNFPLAINIQRYTLFTIPKFIENKDDFIKKLVKIVPKIKRSTLKKIKSRKSYTWLARKIELTDQQVLRLKKMPNLYLNKVPKRIYPNKNFASQLIGFVGTDNKGLSGLESKLDEQLHGSPKRIRYIKDAKGRLVKFSVDKQGVKGQSFKLTIDKEIQFIAEKYLKQSILKYKADSGGVGVMDVKTGKILAMANYPSFNPNKIINRERKYWQSSFIVNPFEPGSVFKALTIASALENNIVTPQAGYYCEQGKFLVGDHLITEAESDHGRGWLSVSDILAYSSNIGTTKIALDLKWENLSKTLKKFKIGNKTNIFLPGESRGIFPSKRISPLKLSNISFGQGIATTGIQILSAYSAIANNGIWVKPLILENEKVKQHRIITKKTANQVTEMLVSAVEKGTGQIVKIPGFEIAGKTGTAQRAINGHYQGYISSFIGFPVNVQNKFVIYVYIDNPRKQYYGSIVAAPIFKKIANFMLLKNKEIENNKILIASPQENIAKIKSHFSKLKYSKNKVTNFLHFDKKSITHFARKYRIKLKLIGSGISYKQKPVANKKYKKQDIIKIYFKVPSYE